MPLGEELKLIEAQVGAALSMSLREIEAQHIAIILQERELYLFRMSGHLLGELL